MWLNCKVIKKCQRLISTSTPLDSIFGRSYHPLIREGSNYDTCKKLTLYPVFRTLGLKFSCNLIGWEHFDHNWRTRFFPEMQFSQNHEEHYCAPFSGLKKIYQCVRFLAKTKIKKNNFGNFFPKWNFFVKLGFASFYP